MRYSIPMVVLLLVLSLPLAQVRAQLVGTNIDIAGETSPDRQRVETTVAVDPHSPSITAAGAQDLRLLSIGEHRWHGYYRSTDGGARWSSTLLPGFPGDTSAAGLASPLRSFNTTSDPVLAFDRSGNLYYAGIAFNSLPSGSVTGQTAFVAKFVNDGADYFGVTLISSLRADKPWIAVDTSGGPNDGNVYLAFDFCSSTSICFTRSTDGGQTFSPITTLLGAGTFPGMAVDPSGNVFVLTITTHKILVNKSTDGGATFLKAVTAFAHMSMIPSPLPGNLFRTVTSPQIAADNLGVYIVWDDFGTNVANVLFIRSTDGGVTWSNPITVNDVITGQHFFPSVAASGGRVSVVWYDSRLGQLPNGTITGLDLFYASSLNAGVSFSASFRITSVSFNPNEVLRSDAPNPDEPFIGDYIEVAASATVVHPIWTDNRNACDTIVPTFDCVDQDAFTATITF